ncbi:MAG TPA: hypothetical protein VHT53_01000 [Candidatus Elarobacter sp.]|nr:hypothetical protein [Candidatus Elarobacter sp.]
MLAPAHAAGSLDAAHAALVTALRADHAERRCGELPLQRVAASASIRPLGRAGRDRVVLAELHEPCICGTQNCPFIAVRLAKPPRVVLSTWGIGARAVPRAGSPPDLIVGEHESVGVLYETRWVFRGGAYTATGAERVRALDGARKPDTVTVRFRPGATSARLHGTIAQDWYDGFAFTARRGQEVAVGRVRSAQPVVLTLFGPRDGDVVRLRAGVPFALPRSGRYGFWVESASVADTPYALTLAIR